MKNNWFYISLVIALAVASLILWDQPPKMLLPDEGPIDESNLIPYAVIDQAYSRHFDVEGQLSYEFSSITLKHFRLDLSRISEGDFTTLDSPNLKLYAENNTWLVEAKQGRLTNQGELFKLIGNVRVWQEKENGTVLELKTDELWIFPTDKIVRTDGHVMIRGPQGVLEADGLVVNLADKHIKLLRNVRGQHEPI